LLQELDYPGRQKIPAVKPGLRVCRIGGLGATGDYMAQAGNASNTMSRILIYRKEGTTEGGGSIHEQKNSLEGSR